MYFIFTTTGDRSVDKDLFQRVIDVWSTKFVIVKVLTCNNELLYGLSPDDVSFPFDFVGKCTDPDVLLPYQEAMLND